MTKSEEYVENKERVSQAEVLSREFERDSRRYERTLSLLEEDE